MESSGAADSITAVEHTAQSVAQGADLVRESEEALQSILELAASVADQNQCHCRRN